MKRGLEFTAKVDECYVSNNSVQLMMPYKDHLFLIGEDGLKYYENIYDEESINKYLDDERRSEFPYSSIPEHYEKNLFRKKAKYVNQIIDFNKKYLQIKDGIIITVEATKTNDGALVNYSVLHSKEWDRRQECSVSRENLERYLKTGYLEYWNNKEYEHVYVISNKNMLLNNDFVADEHFIDSEKENLRQIIDQISYLDEVAKKELLKAVNNLDDIEPHFINKYLMIKTRKNEIDAEIFGLKYLKKGKYSVAVIDVPLPKIEKTNNENILVLKKEPKINLRLNPDVTTEQLSVEHSKVLMKTRY